MNIKNLLNQFLGESNTGPSTHGLSPSALREAASSLNQKMGGMGGCVAVGGIAALLMSSKKARSFAGSAAKVGGAALLGSLAFKAFKNWQASSAKAQPEKTALNQELAALPQTEATFEYELQSNADFQLTLVKAMIAAAKADGHIDDIEQTRIFDAVEQMPSSNDFKFMMMDLLRYPTSVQELASEVNSLEQKTELYLISCFAIDVDNEAENRHLNALANALELPHALTLELQQQANQAALQAV